MKSAFRTVALIGKYKSPETAGPLLELARFLERRKVRVLIDPLTAAQVKKARLPVLSLDDLGREADLAVVIGGDGTMLNIARTLAPHDVALVGVNQGRLGFLTDVSVENMIGTIGTILDGKYVTENRMLLEGRVRSGTKKVSAVLAFNDVVVSKGAQGNMVELEVRINGEFIYNQRSDGLIVATPTGSTAYAMSAGGPIVHPALTVMALVPVSPHTLSNRPIAVAETTTLEIAVKRGADARLHFDGQPQFDLSEGDRVEIRRAEHAAKLVHPPGYSYYAMLREKLRWSESLF